MAQATSGEIACSDSLRRVTMPVRNFPYWTGWITSFVTHFVYDGTTKGNFEKPHKFNEFSK